MSTAEWTDTFGIHHGRMLEPKKWNALANYFIAVAKVANAFHPISNHQRYGITDRWASDEAFILARNIFRQQKVHIEIIENRFMLVNNL